MAGGKRAKIELTQMQRAALEHLVRRHNCSQCLVRRVSIVPACADGHYNEQVSEIVGVYREAVRQWRTRRLDHSERLAASDAGSDETVLRAAIEQALSGRPSQRRTHDLHNRADISYSCADVRDLKRVTGPQLTGRRRNLHDRGV